MNNNPRIHHPSIGKVSHKTSMKEVLIISSVSVLCTIGVYKAVQHFKTVRANSTVKSDVNYIFSTPNGKAVVLSEKEVYGIKQMYDDGVMPSVIANKYKMNTVMVCRVINCINSINK